MRVTIWPGTEPFLIVAPHGSPHDDFNTDIVAKQMAETIGGYAVINTGWHRIPKAKPGESRANLNNLRHCRLEPCCQEFLQPIRDYKEAICKKYGICFVFLIHGMSAKIQERANDDVHAVVGFGQGNPPSHSCDLMFKDRFIYLLQNAGLNVYQGKIGGRFSAWNKHNLNQLFVRHEPDKRVQSLQVELVSGVRFHPDSATAAGKALAEAADKCTWNLDIVPTNWQIKEY